MDDLHFDIWKFKKITNIFYYIYIYIYGEIASCIARLISKYQCISISIKMTLILKCAIHLYLDKLHFKEIVKDMREVNGNIKYI